MRITEHIETARRPFFSYEIVPPPRGRSLKDIIEIVEQLAPLEPPWIDVTTHSPAVQYREKPDGTFVRRTLRKRPGTLGICGVIQNRFKIDTVAHLLCLGFSREETEDALIELNYMGIHNILALRGDAPNVPRSPDKTRHEHPYAVDLVGQIKDVNEGRFLDEMEDSHPLEFCIGVAGYPEKHFEAPSLKTDIDNLKRKIDAGAEFIVTQMFFDNQHYFSFVEKCRAAGITVPIVPGLKVLQSKNQLTSIPKHFHIDLPEALVSEVQSSPQHVTEIGRRWAKMQVEGLLGAGLPGVHFYVLNDVAAVTQIVREVRR